MPLPETGASDSPSRLRARALNGCARHFFNLSRYEEALDALRQAEIEDPSYYPTKIGKANALMMLARYDDALAICDDVISAYPGEAQAYTTKGSTLSRMNRVGEALAYFERGIALNADDYVPYYDFACFWALAGNAGETERYLKRALELNPGINVKTATDPDSSGVRGAEWFRALVAFKRYLTL